MKIRNNIIIFVITNLLITSCSNPTEIKEINKNIVELVTRNGDKMSGNNYLAVWGNNEIFTNFGFRKLSLGDNLKVEEITSLCLDREFSYLKINKERTNILCVDDMSNTYRYGALYEYDILNNNLQMIRDQNHNIVSAVYMHDENEMIYYSYGNFENKVPGFYYFNKLTGKDSMILQYTSEIASELLGESILGFDFHPSENKLLFPVEKRNQTPIICEFKMDDNIIDTFNVDFGEKKSKECIWLRYNNIGNKILYNL